MPECAVASGGLQGLFVCLTRYHKHIEADIHMSKDICPKLMGDRAEHAESMNTWIMAARGTQGQHGRCQKGAHASLCL